MLGRSSIPEMDSIKWRITSGACLKLYWFGFLARDSGLMRVPAGRALLDFAGYVVLAGFLSLSGAAGLLGLFCLACGCLFPGEWLAAGLRQCPLFSLGHRESVFLAAGRENTSGPGLFEGLTFPVGEVVLVDVDGP